MSVHTIFDIETQEYVTAGSLLKRLMMRAGIGRNEWHSLCQSGITRSLGAPTKLSDVFADRRQLPLRDLSPLIKSLELPLDLQNYYIAELLKSYLESDLASFISIPASSDILNVFREKIEQLRLDLAYAQKAIFEHKRDIKKPINVSEKLGKNSSLIKTKSLSSSVRGLEECSALAFTKQQKPKEQVSENGPKKFANYEFDDLDIFAKYEFDGVANFAESHGLDIADKYDEKNQIGDFHFDGYEEEMDRRFEYGLDAKCHIIEQVKDFVIELSQMQHKTTNAAKLVKSLIPVDLPEQLVAYGNRSFVLGEISTTDFEFLPKLRSMENLKINLIALWANDDLDRFKEFINTVELIKSKNNPIWTAVELKAIERKLFAPFANRLMQELIFDFSATYNFFTVSSPSFSKANLLNIDFYKYFDIFVNLVNRHGSIHDATKILFAHSQVKLTRPFVKKVVANYCKYIHTSYNLGFHTVAGLNKDKNAKFIDLNKKLLKIFKEQSNLSFCITEVDRLIASVISSNEYRRECLSAMEDLISTLREDDITEFFENND
ncbi:MAG: hypothetical protein NWQ54_21995 [Paraglaciecola sp.]|nr:hypothetical protein [Paraglaciecola sp.]